MEPVARALREPDLDLRLGRPVAALALAHRLELIPKSVADGQRTKVGGCMRVTAAGHEEDSGARWALRHFAAAGHRRRFADGAANEHDAEPRPPSEPTRVV